MVTNLLNRNGFKLFFMEYLYKILRVLSFQFFPLYPQPDDTHSHLFVMKESNTFIAFFDFLGFEESMYFLFFMSIYQLKIFPDNLGAVIF